MSVSAHQHHPQSVPIVRHFTVQERIGSNPLLFCWCGAMMEVDYSYEAGGTSEARSRLNLFLDQHEACQPKEAMPMINPEKLPEWAKGVVDVISHGNPEVSTPVIERCPRCNKVTRITGNYRGELTNGVSYATDWCSCKPVSVPFTGTAYSYISPQDMETIRIIIREEVHRALHPESEATHD